MSNHIRRGRSPNGAPLMGQDYNQNNDDERQSAATNQRHVFGGDAASGDTTSCNTSTLNDGDLDDDDIRIEEMALNANFDPSFFDVGDSMTDTNDDTTTDGLLLRVSEGEATPPALSGGVASSLGPNPPAHDEDTNVSRPGFTSLLLPSGIGGSTTRSNHNNTAHQQLQTAAAAAFANHHDAILPQQHSLNHHQSQPQHHPINGSFVHPTHPSLMPFAGYNRADSSSALGGYSTAAPIPMLTGGTVTSKPPFTVSRHHHHHRSNKTRKPPPAAAASNNNTTSQQQQQLPPFLLFDAPIELRANYMACQRAQGIAVHEDNNALHYNHSATTGVITSSTSKTMAAVKLVDGRTSRNNSHKTVRNVREQKRTQKIADLIDQLRVKMEEGGWKVGMKQSKFHTLSSCGDYVKHLVKSNREKELALETTKSDLEAKRRKIEEETINATFGSDRDSTTSSLTASSDDPCNNNTNGKKRVKRDRQDHHRHEGNGQAIANPSAGQDSSHSSSANSSGGGYSHTQRDGQSVSVNRMTSSLSDITDSKGSSSEGNSSGCQQQQTSPPQPLHCKPEEIGSSKPGSIYSDAAVAPGVDAREEITTPSGIVVTAGSRTSGSHTTPSTSNESNNSSFDLDYKEVFIKSNVPQILATTSGRIVAWNDFFLRATGLSVEDAGRLTIFSLVRSNKLSSLFEIVAAALRTDDTDRRNKREDRIHCGGGTVTDSSSGAVGTSRLGNDRGSISDSTNTLGNNHSSRIIAHQPQGEGYAAITLPCTVFRGGTRSTAQQEGRIIDQQLYMTVTLMTDEDPQKRCFHCVLTDCPGTNGGSVGMISRELLAELISDPNTNRSHSHKRKRNIQG